MPTTTFYSTADCYVSSQQPNTNLQGNRMYGGYITAADRAYVRMYMNFGTVPPMATVSAATLTMYLREDGDGGTWAGWFYRCTSAMNAATVTWNTQPTNSGDIIAGLSLPAGPGSKIWTFTPAEILAMSKANYGLYMFHTGPGASSYDGFDTIDYSGTAVALTVTYTTPTGNQVIWMFSKLLDDLKRGLVPPQELRRRYQQVWAI